jgi:hypothetical protein
MRSRSTERKAMQLSGLTSAFLMTVSLPITLAGSSLSEAREALRNFCCRRKLAEWTLFLGRFYETVLAEIYE